MKSSIGSTNHRNHVKPEDFGQAKKSKIRKLPKKDSTHSLNFRFTKTDKKQ